MKHSQHYFTNTRITLYALFLCMIPTGANAQLFGGMMKASKYINIGIPATIILEQDVRYFVVSINDNNYLPYTAPTGLATTAKLDADGSPDALINLQGAIPTTGVTISIPVSATGSGTVPAYSVTVSVPASVTEDGIARNLTLSWTAQAYTAATTAITATLKAVGGTLNAKKLDFNAGIGSDYLGVLLGQLVYPYNNTGNTSNFAVHDMPGIPDKMFGLADNGGIVRHKFLYFPVTDKNGRLWLSNNLGADYANTTSPSFNPNQQATAFNDFHAYGSMFQWGRKPDGHELIKWSSGTAGAAINPTTTSTLSDAPTHANFIINVTSPSDWRVTPKEDLWDNEASTNNPCPSGWRVPTDDDLTTLINITEINDEKTAAASKLHFSNPGKRDYSNGTIYYAPSLGCYWSSSPNSPTARDRYFGSGNTGSGWARRANGESVRCIQN